MEFDDPSFTIGRIGESGAEIPVVRTASGVFDLRTIATDIDAEFWSNDGVSGTRAALEAGLLPRIQSHGVRTGAPIAIPGKIVCIGLNYTSAVPIGQLPPVEIVTYLKAGDTVVGPEDDLIIPPGSTAVDWEVELAVVIASRLQYSPDPTTARAAIGGWVLANDTTEREWQHGSSQQWDRGKGFESFTAIGPHLVLEGDFASEPVVLTSRVDGREMQSGTTNEMTFTPEDIVSAASQHLVLRPGDLVLTGTPGGCAASRPEKPFLRPGQIVELTGSAGLGLIRQRTVAASKG